MTAIREWLESLDLGEYIDNFESEKIDLTAVKLLTDEDLENIGLPLGPRRVISAAIQDLKDGTYSVSKNSNGTTPAPTLVGTVADRHAPSTLDSNADSANSNIIYSDTYRSEMRKDDKTKSGVIGDEFWVELTKALIFIAVVPIVLAIIANFSLRLSLLLICMYFIFGCVATVFKMRSIGLIYRSVSFCMVLGAIVAVSLYGRISERVTLSDISEISHLREENPSLYLEKLKSIDKERWRFALADLDPLEFDRMVAAERLKESEDRRKKAVLASRSRDRLIPDHRVISDERVGLATSTARGIVIYVDEDISVQQCLAILKKYFPDAKGIRADGRIGGQVSVHKYSNVFKKMLPWCVENIGDGISFNDSFF